MAICGIAVGSAGPPISERELRAMQASLAADPKTMRTCVLPNVGVSVNEASSSAVFWSDEHVMVAGDADLYPPDEQRDGNCSVGKMIADLYARYGSAFVEKLRGSFALAIWDGQARTLLLVIDRFGFKRLCYANASSGVVFAVQPKTIFAGGRVSKKVDLSAITEYLVYNVVPIPKTAYEGVRRVEPGEYVIWKESGTEKKRYWDMRYPEDDARPAEDVAEDLLACMENSVKLASAGLDLSTTGCFLSGGTDSSSIVGLLTKLNAAPVHAFSIGFSEDRFNELEYARLAAKHFQARHIEGKLGPGEARVVVDKIVEGYDEPFGNSSAIPTYWCAKLARESGMKTLLAGDGGDELFGGNERYREEQIFGFYQKIPRSARRWIIEPAVSTGPAIGMFRRARNYIHLANTGNPDRYCRWRLLRLFSPDVVLASDMPFRNGHSDLLATIRHHHDSAPTATELNRLLYVDVKMTLGDDDLPKVTRSAELVGIRVRFPYLDHELAEFSGRMRADLKVRGLEKRYLFKRATRNLLPAAILKKKKHGFGLPIGFWLKSNPQWHAWAKEILYDPKTYQRGYFRREFIEQLFQNMQQDDTPYFGDLLWVFLVLELWHRRHVEVNACCA
jgi:asparagine synthase (glutamine-hydrolysing)